MTTHRFFVDQAHVDCLSGIIKIVDAGQVKQITRVLRLGVGDAIEVIDGTGPVYECKIESVDKQVLVTSIISKKESNRRQPFSLIVVLPLLKGGRFETCLAKLTEIGVDKIVPMVSKRSVVKLSDVERRSSKALDASSQAYAESPQMKRWMSIAREATEQCERTRSPYVVHPTTLDQAVNHLRLTDNAGLTFICAERSQAPHLITMLHSKHSGQAPDIVPPSDISLIIGPEGGFTDEEIQNAISLGCIPCSLGDNILRSDTAAIAAAFMVRSFGEFLLSQSGYQSDTRHHP